MQIYTIPIIIEENIGTQGGINNERIKSKYRTRNFTKTKK
ncbi:hypothetical protein CDIMF43_220238 [Carnobacterium divergens]|nr:hypothetical protein CDIMF43_220238 [Carnobacterium divergens]